MATFVLVHGAMHGGWCWRDVRPLLTARGHDVRTPTLAGPTDHEHALDPGIGVATHVDDLVGLLERENLQDVHLVLHSYAGVLAGPVVERTGTRVAEVTFLGAFLVSPGQSLLDVEPPEVAERYRLAAAANGGILKADASFLDQWGVTDPALRAWVGPQLTDFSARCQSDPVEYDPAALDRLPKTYVAHTAPPLASLARFRAEAVAAGWDVVDVASGHDMMLAEPVATVDVLDRRHGAGV